MGSGSPSGERTAPPPTGWRRAARSGRARDDEGALRSGLRVARGRLLRALPRCDQLPVPRIGPFTPGRAGAPVAGARVGLQRAVSPAHHSIGIIGRRLEAVPVRAVRSGRSLPALRPCSRCGPGSPCGPWGPDGPTSPCGPGSPSSPARHPALAHRQHHPPRPAPAPLSRPGSAPAPLPSPADPRSLWPGPARQASRPQAVTHALPQCVFTTRRAAGGAACPVRGPARWTRDILRGSPLAVR